MAGPGMWTGAAWRRRLLSRAFYLIYGPLAWSYDAVSWVVSLGQWRQWAAVALEFAPGPRVLEVGHGPGHLLAALAERHALAVGVDASRQMGEMARRRLLRRGLAPLVARGRGESLPLAGGGFDGVVATFPAPYILAPETAAELWRVLRPGGRLVIVPEAELTGGGPAGRALEWLYRLTGQRGAGGDGGAVWREALGRAGFGVAVHRIARRGSAITVVVGVKGGMG